MDRSAKKVCTSFALTSFSLIKYFEPFSRSIFLLITISSISKYFPGPSFCELSIVIITSDIFFAGLFDVPENIISSIPDPRILFADVSPIHHRKDSTIFDLPHPLGPTIPVKPS